MYRLNNNDLHPLSIHTKVSILQMYRLNIIKKRRKNERYISFNTPNVSVKLIKGEFSMFLSSFQYSKCIG